MIHWPVKQVGMWLAASSAVLFLASGCSLPGSAATLSQPGTPEVQVFTVAGGGQTVTGKIAAADEVKVSSKLGARVTAVHVKEGTRVHKGQVLVELDSSDYQAQVNQAQAGLQQAQAGLAAAQAKLADTKAGSRRRNCSGSRRRWNKPMRPMRMPRKITIARRISMMPGRRPKRPWIRPSWPSPRRKAPLSRRRRSSISPRREQRKTPLPPLKPR
ncbi:exported protein of unknown function [Kyrpidia spormannii]|uniref:Uncharacterized protein n=1 Tax=Kyrpidia spormannii TaxID=2055160 RepID=A0A6F9EGX9_9BACL|nr:exported protein of unknown function [Kyrpidia spormannii]